MSPGADDEGVEAGELGLLDATRSGPVRRGGDGGPVVGFLGPAGTFSELAADRLIGAAAGELRPLESIAVLIQAVARPLGPEPQRLDAVVVPIENSTEGSVGATLDTLVDEPDLVITAEIDLAIEQLLIARSALPLDAITEVYSHPQGIAQARRFLAEHLPGAGVVPVTSTARAVELVAGSDASAAAIGSRRAAELHGCVVLRDDIQEQVNVTRFILVERRGGTSIAPAPVPRAEPARRAGDAPGGARAKTTVVFEGDGDGSPGWLVRCLSEFAFRGVNLTKIESRPLRGRLGHYRFFADLLGAVDQDPIRDAISGLEHHCDAVRVLGSYLVTDAPG